MGQWTPHPLTAGEELTGTGAHRKIHGVENAGEGVLGDDRSEPDLRVEGVAGRGGVEHCEELLDERVIDRCMDEQPTCARAALAGLHQWSLMRRQHRRAVQVRIVEDDVGRLSAELGDHRGQVLGRRADHGARGGSATGEVDLANSRMPHEGGPALSTGGQDVHQAGGKSGFQTQLAEAQGGQGRQLGRLEDDGVPGGKGRCDTGTGHRQCAVPRGDHPDHPVGFPLDEVDVE